MKVLILEDELLVADYLSDILNTLDVEVAGTANNINSAVELMKDNPADLAFIDINLDDEKNGLDFAQELKKNWPKVPFIFITASLEKPTIQSAIKLQPLSFVSKPFQESDIIASIELFKIKSADIDGEGNSNVSLQIKSFNQEIFIPFDDILYIEADGMYSKIFTPEKIFTERLPLKEIINGLSSDNFIRIHRSFIVNKKHISLRKKAFVKIRNKEIPISRSYFDSI